ncbi:MAG: methyl-accepting chemotaxis protein [Spirochaetales bacterium]
MKSSEGIRFGIGTKLILGLGALIALSVLIGTIAMVSMLSIQTTSNELSEQFLPEALIANEVERQTLTLMYNVRGYWLSGESKYYDQALLNQQALQKALADIQVLLDKSPKLVKLKEALPKAQAAFATYSELIKQTKIGTDGIVKARDAMNAAAGDFVTSITKYIDNQNESMAKDIAAGAKAAALSQRVSKINEGNLIMDLGNAIRIANFKTQALRDVSYINQLMGNFTIIDDKVKALLSITVQQLNKDQLNEVTNSVGAYKTAVTDWLAHNATLDSLATQRATVATELGDLAQATSLAGVTISQEKATANSVIISVANWTIIAGLLISILLGIGVAFVLIRAITVPLSLVTVLSRKVTGGDFAIERTTVKSRDELGALIESFYDMVDGLKAKAAIIENIANGNLTNTIPLASDDDNLGRSLQLMQKSLNEILTQVNIAVEQIASGSDQVSTAAQSLSQGATEQASSLEEITASSNEIHGQSKQNAENATTANQLAKVASKNAQEGDQRMQGLMVLIESMTKSSEDTKKIVKTIDDIAFQVNLLALNANVEAARAGKYGKGFAVVAEEVRNLAVRSGNAVRETTQMVEQQILNIQQVNQTAEATGGQLNEILTNANKVADFLEEIAASSHEQATAMGQINGGLDQIDQVTQSNTASAEESASAAEELSGQAQQLKVMVSRFQLTKDGTSARPVAAPPTARHTLAKATPHSSAPKPSTSKPYTPPAGSKPDILLNDDFDTF